MVLVEQELTPFPPDKVAALIILQRKFMPTKRFKRI